MNHPYLSNPPIICHNRTMDMAFLVQTRQSNKCGSVRNDEIINLNLVSGVGPWVGSPCLLQDTSNIYWFHLPKTINQERTKNPEMRSNFKQILLYCLGPQTQNQGLREIDLDPRAKKASDKINMWKQGRNTQKKASHIVQPELTYGSQHLERYTWNPVLREEQIGPEP